MAMKQGLLYLGLYLLCLQTILVNAVPDWVPPEIFDMVADDKARCMSEHGTTQGQYFAARAVTTATRYSTSPNASNQPRQT
ncbi:hypothetical protein E2986_07428 [Frieseomelitta varia]|uniref:Uncharacterized protein n=1 Tax=Frieseomelitta varia TaxID=561572 RepID=A0A833SLM2_9HYME|nr:hypothetical protein E2986_07428 [Frieseomelitta varia]